MSNCNPHRMGPQRVGNSGVATEPFTYDEGVTIIAACETILDSFESTDPVVKMSRGNEAALLRSVIRKMKAATGLARNS